MESMKHDFDGAVAFVQFARIMRLDAEDGLYDEVRDAVSGYSQYGKIDAWTEDNKREFTDEINEIRNSYAY